MFDLKLPDLAETDAQVVADFFDRVFNHPLPVAEIGDVDRWIPIFTRAYQLLEKWARPDPVAAVRRGWNEFLNLRAYKLAYFAASAPVLPMLAARARAAAALCAAYNPTAANWRPAPFRGRGKIKLAVELKSFVASPETLATLPFFMNLSPKKFAVTAFLSMPERTPLMDEFVAKYGAENLIISPPEEGWKNLDRWRAGDYDLFLMVTNTSSVVNNACLAGMYRVARKQLVMFCQPHTTALPAVDGFIVGRDLHLDPNDFTEKLYYLDGSGICFRPAPVEPPSPNIAFTRENFGLPPEGEILVSGANYYKLRAELLDFWARLLAARPRATMLLFPFNPFWSMNYAKEDFVRRVAAACAKHGIAPSRFQVLMQPLPRRADVRQLMALGDIYLDSFPYSGATSLLDPLALGMPIVAMGTRTVCGGQGAALLREDGLDELVANNEDEYLAICRRLLDDRDYRASIAARIKQVMSDRPAIHDLEKFNEKIERVYKKVYGEIK
ncbi:MAG: hypothetical protein LBP75_07645 [Planctomycetota bacterium]|jgi:predicted O-linked N-acetylglucosamine transferase (SPINDLY family)|nr:hypothetical protein [Planctomycetota bacterium]